MKKVIPLIVVTVILLVFSQISFVQEPETNDFKYVGVSKCKMCHKGAKKGEQFEIWEKSAHAKAYEGAKASDKFTDECLKCHATGVYNEKGEKNPPAMFDKSYKIEEGVTCESCHGAGSEYKKMATMKDHDKYVAAGGLIPGEKDCLKCHDNSFHKRPDYKFVFEERMKAIRHKVPAK